MTRMAAIAKKRTETASTYAMEVAAENSSPPRLRSNPISHLKSARASGGSPLNDCPRASQARESLNSAAIWLAGRRVPMTFMLSGIDPMGM